MDGSLWRRCLDRLEGELSAQQFNTWIRPLHAVEDTDELRLLAPNRFVRDWVSDHFVDRITEVVNYLGPARETRVVIQVGSREVPAPRSEPAHRAPPKTGEVPS